MIAIWTSSSWPTIPLICGKRPHILRLMVRHTCFHHKSNNWWLNITCRLCCYRCSLVHELLMQSGGFDQNEVELGAGFYAPLFHPHPHILVALGVIALA